MSSPKDQDPYLLAAIDDEVVCDIPIGEDYYFDAHGYIIEIYDKLYEILVERFGSVYECAPYCANESGEPEDARGEEILSGEQLWRSTDTSGAVAYSGLLCGDDVNDTCKTYVFPSRSIQYLPEQDWDELEQAARSYCVSHGIGW